MSLTRIGSIGINTGIAFAGVTTIVTLNTANDALSIGATVNVGSGITLGASGDIFATGVSTVTTLKVGSGVTVSSDGDVFFTGIATGNGSGLTALNATQLTSGTVPTARLGSGTASSSTFLRGDSTFQTVNTDLVSDTSPQLGGNLDVNTKNIVFGDSSDGSSDDVLSFGASGDLKIFHQNDQSRIVESGPSVLKIMGSDVRISNAGNTADYFQGNDGSDVKLFHNGNLKFATTSAGVDVTGTLSAGAANLGTGDLTLTGNINISDSTGGGNNRIIFGAGDDLQLWHDGSHSYIADEGTGELKILSNLFRVNNAANNEAMIKAEENAGVTLSYNGNTSIETIADGGVKATGNYVVGTSGRGLQFNASDSGSANLLDDYEEGTFNITVTSGGTVSSFSHNKCSYIKIGRQVFVQIYTAINGSGNGNIFKIGNLPFAAANYSTYGFGGFYIAYENNAFQTTGVAGHVQNLGTDINFYKPDSNIFPGNGGNVFGNRDFILIGQYQSGS